MNEALPSTSDLGSEQFKWYTAAGIGNTLFLLGYYGALTVAPIVVVYPIIPTNIFFVLLLPYFS